MGTFVTTSGFVKRTVQQVLGAFNTAMQTIFGPTVDISPEGPTGQLLGLPAAGLGDVWDALQEVYSSMDPAQATGAALDRLCAYTGVSRIAASASTVKALLYTDAANSGVTIPSGSQARRVRGAVVFSLSTNTVIAPGSCQDIYLSFASVPASGTPGVALTTSFGTFTITMPTVTDATARAVAGLELFATAIQASSWGLGGGVAQVWNAGVLQQPASDALGGNQVTTGVVLRLTHVLTPFGVTLSGTWALQAVGAQGLFTCNLTGAQTVSTNELTSIVTPQTGWNSVTNLVLGVPGRDVESDADLRIRRKAHLGSGFATEAAMQAYILNTVPGVSSVTISSNRGDSVDAFSAPAHSLTVTVVGGASANAIAQAIWDSMPAGIYANGDHSGTATDSQGGTHTINYTVPVAVPIWVKILYDLYAEETFPGQAAVSAAVASWAAAEFSPGLDVIAPRFLSAVYTIPGIGNAQVTVSTDGTTFVTGPITMSAGQVATVDPAHISYGVL